MHTHTNSGLGIADFLIERGPDCLVVVMKAAKRGKSEASQTSCSICYPATQ